MNIFMRGENSVPIIIAKKSVKQEPKIINRRKFLGLKAGIAALAERAIDIVLDCFWEVEQEVVDKGQSDVIHYAIDVSDDPGSGSPELVVTKLDGRARPGCGIYCEVISVEGIKEQQSGESTGPQQTGSKAKLVQPKLRRPVNTQGRISSEDVA